MQINWLDKCREVKNKRDIISIFSHADEEFQELWDEIELALAEKPQGDDGIVGEAVDVILCMLDLISIYAPELTTNDLQLIMQKKFQKWKDVYGE